MTKETMDTEKKIFKYFKITGKDKIYYFGDRSFNFKSDIYYNIDNFDKEIREIIYYIIVRNIQQFEIIPMSKEEDIKLENTNNVGIDRLEFQLKQLNDSIQYIMRKIDSDSIKLLGQKSNIQQISDDDNLNYIPEIDLDLNNIKIIDSVSLIKKSEIGNEINL